jgi:branched-chain amino acid transport system substrate-binding protein
MLLHLRRRALRLAALTAVIGSLAAGLAACGPGTGAAGGTACGPASSAAPGVTPTEVRAGMTWSDTGPAADSTRAFRAGVDARLDVANDAEGGVFGRRVSYAWRDDQADPRVHLTNVQELLDQEHVFGFLDGSGAGGESADLLQQRGVPVTGPADDPSWLGRNNMFSWFYQGDGSSTAWGKYVYEQGGTRAAIFAIDTSAPSEDFTQQFGASLKARGVKVVRTFQTSSAIADYATVARQLKAANVDVIGGALLPETAAGLLTELRKIGVALGGRLKVVLLPQGYDGSNLTRYGPALAGVSLFTSIRPFELDTPGQQRFREAMNTYSPEIQPATQDSAVDGWLAADLFVRGLREAGPCPTRESFITGLRGVKDYDSAGMTPQDTISLSTNYQNVSVCYGVIRVSRAGDAFEPDTQPECGVVITRERMDVLNQQP